MKKMFAAGFLVTVLATSVYAEPHYSIIIDAGSSGSRLHLFEYNENQHGVPDIKEIATEKVSPGLSSFAKEPQKVDAYLQPLFDHALQKIPQVSQNAVTVSILGTAGMRLIPDDAPKIYKQVNSFLQSHYQFQIKKIETVTGFDEGLYGWLDVNYLAKTFQNQTSTLGSIDIGGASTQIAFETQDASYQADEVTLKINGKNHTVFVKSFLGLGQDQARETMNAFPAFNSCYPHGYKSTGAFDFGTCRGLYKQVISDKRVQEQIPSTQNQTFIAYSSAFYAYKFFQTVQTSAQAVVEKRIKEYCVDHDWNWFQDTYKQEPANLLPNYCTNAVYITELLYNTYQITGNHLQVADRIDDRGIDWTLGALVYQLISK